MQQYAAQSPPQNSPVRGDNLTLSVINARMKHLGLPHLDKNNVESLISEISRDRFVRVLNLASSDTSARGYLITNMEKVGIDCNAPMDEQPSRSQNSNQEQNRARGQQQSRGNNQQQSRGNNQQQSRGNNQQQSRGNNQQGRDTGFDLSDHVSHHVYGGKAALCFQSDATRGGADGSKSIQTIRLDAADVISRRDFNWNEKISIQMTRGELPIVLAVLLGFLPECEFKMHGPEKAKGFIIKDQGDKMFVQVFDKGKSLKSVPMTPEDTFEVTKIIIRQMQRNAPWLTGAEIITLIRSVAARKPKAHRH